LLDAGLEPLELVAHNINPSRPKFGDGTRNSRDAHRPGGMASWSVHEAPRSWLTNRRAIGRPIWGHADGSGTERRQVSERRPIVDA